jgi:hypothetical protein
MDLKPIGELASLSGARSNACRVPLVVFVFSFGRLAFGPPTVERF